MAGENDWLRVLMDEALERDEQPLWRPPVDSFRGSGSGNPCVRALAFEALGHCVPFEARVLRIFATGKAIELVIVESARKAKVLVEKSDQLAGVIKGENGKPLITCHIDMLANRPTDGQRFLIEIKSINEHQFDNLPKEHGPTLASKSPLFEKYRNYVVQWNTYAFTPEVDLNEGCLLFEAKNTQKQKYYWLRRDQDMLEETVNRHECAARFAVDAPRQLAPVPEGFDPQQDKGPCGRCDHRYLCKRLPVGAVNYDDVRTEDAKVRG